MTEIKLVLPELTEAIQALALAIAARAETTPNGTTVGAPHTSTTCVPAEQPTPNPTAPATAPQTAPVAPNVPSANYPTDANQTPTFPDTLTSTPPVQAPTFAPAVPIAAPQYTLEMIAKAGTALVDAGKLPEVTALLARYGVDVLTALDPSNYGAVAMELRAMGAQI